MDANLILGLFGAFGTIVGVVGLALYLRDRRRVELRYEFTNDTLIGREVKPLPAELTIQYRGRPLTNLRKSNLILWNRGTQSVRNTDLARPIVITFPDGAEIFSMHFEHQSTTENEVYIQAGAELSVTLIFAFLSVNQGFNIEFLYSCEKGSPRVTATLIEAPRGLVDNKDNQPATIFQRYITVSNILSVTLGMIAVICWEWKSRISSDYFALLVAAATSVIPVIIGLQLRGTDRRKPPPAHLLSAK